MKTQQRGQYQMSVDGVPRRYCDRQDIALQCAVPESEMATVMQTQHPTELARLRCLVTGHAPFFSPACHLGLDARFGQDISPPLRAAR